MSEFNTSGKSADDSLYDAVDAPGTVTKEYEDFWAEHSRGGKAMDVYDYYEQKILEIRSGVPTWVRSQPGASNEVFHLHTNQRHIGSIAIDSDRAIAKLLTNNPDTTTYQEDFSHSTAELNFLNAAKLLEDTVPSQS